MDMSHQAVNRIIERHRWDGLVAFSWILAIAAIAMSIWLIYKFGVIEVTSFVGTTYSRTETHYNFIVWGYGAGLSVSAILLAGLFSMINSSYKNSCDQLAASFRIEKILKGQAGEIDQDSAEDSEPVSPEWGLKVEWVNHDSPLRWILHNGCVIVTINGVPANNTGQASSLIIDGDNIIEIITMQGRRTTKEIHMSKGDLGIKAQPCKLDK